MNIANEKEINPVLVPGEQLYLAATLDTLEVGASIESFKKVSHITLVPWFSLHEDRWNELDAGIQEITNEYTFGPIQIMESDLYGDDRTLPVKRLFGITALQPGFATQRLVRKLDGNFDQTYMGINYSPHMTQVAQNPFENGQTINLDAISLFSKLSDADQKHVKKIYKREVIA